MRPRAREGVWARVDRLKRQRAERDTREFPIEVSLSFYITDPDEARSIIVKAGIPIQPVIIRGGPILPARGRLTHFNDHAAGLCRVRWEPTA